MASRHMAAGRARARVHGEGKKGQAGRQGLGSSEGARTQSLPVYLGDAAGWVVRVLANGHFAGQAPTDLPRYADIGIAALRPQAGDIGVTSWTEDTQVTRRLRPTDAGQN